MTVSLVVLARGIVLSSPSPYRQLTSSSDKAATSIHAARRGLPNPHPPEGPRCGGSGRIRIEPEPGFDTKEVEFDPCSGYEDCDPLDCSRQPSGTEGEEATVLMSDEERARLREIAYWAEKRGMVGTQVAFLHHLADDSPSLFAAKLDRKLVLDHLDSHGEEAVDAGTKALLEVLTEVCPVCGGDNSGGGIDEPAYACDHCESRTRIPAGRDSRLTKEQLDSKEIRVVVMDALRAARAQRFGDLIGAQADLVVRAIRDAAFSDDHSFKGGS